MTIKELAFSAQQHLQASTGTQIKRAHISGRYTLTHFIGILTSIQWKYPTLTSSSHSHNGRHIVSRTEV